MIQVKANGFIYSGFESISITKSMQSISDTFSLEVFNGDQLNINGNDLIQILDDNKTKFTGYVDDYNLSIGDKKKPLVLAGRSKTCDLVDCNIKEIKQYNAQTPKQIISDLVSPFGLKVSSTLTLDSIDSFDTKVGETYFNAINRLCKQYNILPISDSLGNLKLIKNENKKISNTLKDNDLLSIDFNQNFTSRFSEYIYKQEFLIKDSTDSNVKDKDITRFRPFVDINSDDKTNEDMAKWKRNNDISKSINLQIVIDNWDIEINTIIKIDTSIVKNDFLVKDITYTYDNGGKKASATLVDKGLFNV